MASGLNREGREARGGWRTGRHGSGKGLNYEDGNKMVVGENKEEERKRDRNVCSQSSVS